MAGFLDHIKLFTDGGARGNPGPGAIGILILDNSNQELERHSECIGHTTNNRAEYRALVKGLDMCAHHTRKRVTCFMDSELVVKQMNGDYRLKNDELRKLFHEVTKCAGVFEHVTYQHVGRKNSYMKKVDRMLNDAQEGR